MALTKSDRLSGHSSTLSEWVKAVADARGISSKEIAMLAGVNTAHNRISGDTVWQESEIDLFARRINAGEAPLTAEETKRLDAERVRYQQEAHDALMEAKTLRDFVIAACERREFSMAELSQRIDRHMHFINTGLRIGQLPESVRVPIKKELKLTMEEAGVYDALYATVCPAWADMLGHHTQEEADVRVTAPTSQVSDASPVSNEAFRSNPLIRAFAEILNKPPLHIVELPDSQTGMVNTRWKRGLCEGFDRFFLERAAKSLGIVNHGDLAKLNAANDTLKLERERD